MKGKMMLLAAALAAALAMPAAAVAETGFADSGERGAAKMERWEITQLLDTTGIRMADIRFDEAPNTAYPYAAGRLSTGTTDMFLARMNAMRKLAGVPAVACDPGLTETAQYGTTLEAASGQYGHTVGKPADMPDEFYGKGSASLLSCCIYHLNTGNADLAIDGFLNDYGEVNMDKQGHRRYFLNPQMGKTGFGYAVSPGAGYYDDVYFNVYAFDRSGGAVDYDFISWPASGYFPGDRFLFEGRTAWSVSLNPALYQTPDANTVKVRLVRESDGRTWEFGKTDAAPVYDNGDPFFFAGASIPGLADAVLFRPDGITEYDGAYQAEITGLKHRDGSDAAIRFRVEFFDTRKFRGGPGFGPGRSVQTTG